MALVLALGLLLACATSTGRTTAVCGRWMIARSALEDVWRHRVAALRTLEGTYMPPPTPGEAAFASIDVGEHYAIVDRGARALAFRVIEHLAARLSAGARCGVELLPGPTPAWTERAVVRIDLSQDLGDALLDVDETLERIEPVPTGLGVDVEVPRARVSPEHEPTRMELPTYYLVRPRGCAEPACESLVEAIHELVRP